ncbi:MAG TPA: 23S rRNA (pseudouridine(1915)-N(3))-methyltransferase RlmH [Savagea sp.]
MQMTIISVGKLKEKYLKLGIAEFEKRLQAYTKMKMIEVPDEKAPEQLSESEMELVKKKEGERILAKIGPQEYVIALDLQGKMWTSEQLSSEIESLMTYGNSKITFIIGGSLGIHEDVLKRADAKLSFSKMTFPHQLMRLILVEQIYRAFRIMNGEPYHK